MPAFFDGDDENGDAAFVVKPAPAPYPVINPAVDPAPPTIPNPVAADEQVIQAKTSVRAPIGDALLFLGSTCSELLGQFLAMWPSLGAEAVPFPIPYPSSWASGGRVVDIGRVGVETSVDEDVSRVSLYGVGPQAPTP